MRAAFPAVAYTDPEIAWAGLTETEAKARGIEYGKGMFPWAASGRSLALNRDDGFTKLLFDKETHRVLGAGIVGTNAGDLIAEVALAIEMGADATDIGLTIHPHPTLSETVAFAAEAFDGTLTDLYIPKRSPRCLEAFIVRWFSQRRWPAAALRRRLRMKLAWISNGTCRRSARCSAVQRRPWRRERMRSPRRSMQLNHLYELKLLGAGAGDLCGHTRRRKSPRAGSYAGLVTFKIPASGSYRVAIDMPFWIDVVSDGALVAANDFQGQHGCSSPHKIVEFDLTRNAAVLSAVEQCRSGERPADHYRDAGAKVIGSTDDRAVMCRLAEMGSCGASMQLFRNAVFSAPISFFALASLRQAVRFTCFAAASPATGPGLEPWQAGAVPWARWRQA